MRQDTQGRFQMSGRFLAAVISVLSLATLPAAAQAPASARQVKATPPAKTWTPPRTPYGDPDLQGLWTNATVTPFERPGQFAGKEVLTEWEAAEFEKTTN